AGQFWVGTYERSGDAAQGTLTSVPFIVTHRYAAFLIGGGPTEPTRIELVRKENNRVFYKTSGDQNENMHRVVVALNDLAGNVIGGWDLGLGGGWGGGAPELLFLRDKSGDDKPDGAPEVVLDGWAYQDTHETLNAFIWGPDGWIYVCHGVFTHSRVGKPGTPDKDRTPINCGVWRYHPTKHVFEVFAQGTSNPWGLDFDEHGQAFVTAWVGPPALPNVQNV